LLVLSLLIGPTPSRAQEGTARHDSARAHIRNGHALAAAGDTPAALAQLAEAVAVAPDFAEAHYQLGRFLARNTTPEDEEDSRDRRRAQRELLEAIDLDPSNPVYLAELGQLRLGRNLPGKGDSILAGAIERLSAGGPADRALLADLYFNLGFIEERDYERFRDKHMVTPTRMAPTTTVTPTLSPWLGRYIDAHAYLENAPEIPESGLAVKERIFKYYRNALRYDPTHIAASKRLLLYNLEDNLLPEYMSIARRLADAHPDHPEANLYLGLGLHALGREEEAGEAFDKALAAMSPEEKAPFLSPEPVMRPRPAKAYKQLDQESRGRFEDLFWRMSDPLYLTDANERQLEHLSRVAYADLRFSEPATGRRGWETERGIIFIRYGPPDVIARVTRSISQGATSTIIWAYSGSTAFMFRQQPGYFYTRFAGDYEWVANEARYHQPAAYANIPSIPLLLEIPVQVARFRGDSPQDLAVEIHSELPLEGLAAGLDLEESEIETGFFLLNMQGEKIVREVKTEVLSYADAPARNPLRSWRLHLPAAGRLVAAVEARDVTSWRAAVARDTFTAEFFTDDSLSVSDILLADNIRLLSRKPKRRSDFDIAANAARRYVPDQPVLMYYELYGLDRDAEGFASYEVSLAVTVRSLSREGTILGGDRNPLAILGVLADAWGFTIVGDDRLELRFSRTLDMKDRDRATEYHSLDLRKAPPGEYEITLKVWDNQRQQLASRTRTFTVIREN
jgi:GWxTD domain-containing protein